MRKNYSVIGEDGLTIIISYDDDNVQDNEEKFVIKRYAYHVGLKISETLFGKAIMSLTIDEAVELFNDVCLSKGDRIQMLLSDFQIVYGGENNAD